MRTSGADVSRTNSSRRKAGFGCQGPRARVAFCRRDASGWVVGSAARAGCSAETRCCSPERAAVPRQLERRRLLCRGEGAAGPARGATRKRRAGVAPWRRTESRRRRAKWARKSRIACCGWPFVGGKTSGPPTAGGFARSSRNGPGSSRKSGVHLGSREDICKGDGTDAPRAAPAGGWAVGSEAPTRPVPLLARQPNTRSGALTAAGRSRAVRPGPKSLWTSHSGHPHSGTSREVRSSRSG